MNSEGEIDTKGNSHLSITKLKMKGFSLIFSNVSTKSFLNLSSNFVEIFL